MTNSVLGMNINASSPVAVPVEASAILQAGVPVIPVTTQGYTAYTSQGKGKVQDQVCIYVCPEPVGITRGKTEFYGDYVVVYKNGQGKSEDRIKGINEAVAEHIITKYGKHEGIILLFDIDHDINLEEDVLMNDKVKEALAYCVEHLAKPKSFLIKVIPTPDNKHKALFFTSKYVETTTSPTFCKNIDQAFSKGQYSPKKK